MLSVQLRQTRPVHLEAQLECAAGELLAVVGPSGTGKSTLLKAIAGLLEGATGTVRVAGQTWLDSDAGVNLAAHRRRVGFVFQSYALFPHLSVLGNVMSAAEGTRGEREQRAAAMLASVHMTGMEGRRPAQLSGGQQQRVALARALARQPEVLLLDEPFSAVDQMTRERLYEELAELRSTLSIPTVLVTHSIPEAQVLADRMVVLHRGRTLQQGTPEEVYRRPSEADVARLLGHKNVFTGLMRPQGVLDWAGLPLTVITNLSHGEVAFTVATDDVRLVEDGREGLNTFQAEVLRQVPIGANTRVYARAPNGSVVALTASKHVLERRRVAPGRTVWLSLPPETVHVMPSQT